MSGPKVVRVITREEMIARGERLLGDLDYASDQWHAIAKSFETVSSDEINAIATRRERIASLLHSGNFLKFEQEARKEMAYLYADIDRRREQAAAAQAKVIAAKFRVRESAQSFLSSLSKVEGNANHSIIARLKGLISKRDGEIELLEAESILQDAFRALSPIQRNEDSPTPTLSQSERDLIDRLRTGLTETSLADWKASQLGTAGLSHLLEDISSRLGRLRAIGEEQLSDDFSRKFFALQCNDLASGSDPRIDSLSIEIDQAIQRARETSTILLKAGSLAKNLDAVKSQAARELSAKLLADCNARRLNDLDALIASAETLIANEHKRTAADSRRKAMLKGLADLGYEVREDMATAWSKNGRMVLAKADRSDYGVEMAADQNAERVQVRAVALSVNRDLNRDNDAETLWCSEFTALREKFATEGSSITIEAARGIGEVALKVVELGNQDLNATRMETTNKGLSGFSERRS